MTINLPKIKTPGERIKYIRDKLLKLSRAEVSIKYGLSPDTLAAWESLKIKITEKGIDRCIKIFNSESLIVSREWILSGEGLSPNFSFDLSRYFKTINPENREEKIDDSILLAKEIEFFRNLSHNSVTGLITSDDMLPIYSKGDHVGGRLRFGKEIEFCIGKDCIIKTKDGEMYIRRVAKNPQAKRYNLVCLNPAWDGNPEPVIFNIEIESAAPIVWHRRLDD